MKYLRRSKCSGSLRRRLARARGVIVMECERHELRGHRRCLCALIGGTHLSIAIGAPSLLTASARFLFPHLAEPARDIVPPLCARLAPVSASDQNDRDSATYKPRLEFVLRERCGIQSLDGNCRRVCGCRLRYGRTRPMVIRPLAPRASLVRRLKRFRWCVRERLERVRCPRRHSSRAQVRSPWPRLRHR